MSEDLTLPGVLNDLTDQRQLATLNEILAQLVARVNQIDPGSVALSWLDGAAAGQVIASAGIGASPVWSASPTLTGATFSGLNASQPVKTTAARALTTALIVNADIDNAASIAWSKLDTTGSNVDTVDTKHAADFILKSAVASPYTVTNGSTDRAYDANATTTDELADVLGTVIADLHTAGVPGF